jgi:hypothetical protein
LPLYHSFLVQKVLIYRNRGTKHESSDVGSASKLKRSRDARSISEKVKIMDVIEIEKKIGSKPTPQTVRPPG